MLDLLLFPEGTPNDVKVFTPNSINSATSSFAVWQKPRGKTMASILLQGPGGNGGLGAVGAVSTAAGGGGGGSGGTTHVVIPLALLPDRLYVFTPCGGLGANARVSVSPDTTAINTLLIANGGGVGGDAVGATAGAGGTSGAAATAATMPLGWGFITKAVAGIGGWSGAVTGQPGAGILGNNGTLSGGGQGGAGLNGSGVAGSNGGDTSTALYFPALLGGLGGSSATTPPTNGAHGIMAMKGLMCFYGGTGGGSTHGSATGAGLVQARGGDGHYGAGGGGNGGALTGTTQLSTGGRGGDSFCVITCW